MLQLNDLQRKLASAYAALTEDTCHALPPLYRRDLYDDLRRLGLLWTVNLCGSLAVKTARKVLPLWEAQSEINLPEQLLDLADVVLQDNSRQDEARTEVQRIWNRLGEMQEDYGIGLQANFVGLAAALALFEALGTDPFEDIPLDKATRDTDLDVSSSDTALLAVSAYAGPLWDPTSNPLRRREFWIWWLTDAIPGVVNDARANVAMS